jgi:hypothetical protein
MAKNSDQIAVCTRRVFLWSKGYLQAIVIMFILSSCLCRTLPSSLRENVTSKCPLRAILYKGGSMEILSVEAVTAYGIYQHFPLNLQQVYLHATVTTAVLWTPLIYFRVGGRGCEL